MASLGKNKINGQAMKRAAVDIDTEDEILPAIILSCGDEDDDEDQSEDSQSSENHGPSKKKRQSDLLDEQLMAYLELMKKFLLKPKLKPSSTDKFVAYIGSLLEDVPAEKRRKCQAAILTVAHAYAEGHEVRIEIIHPEENEVKVENTD